jgi:asparaginyl-tRNA synthetase
MEFMADKFDKTCIDRLRMVSSTPFERISYTEAVELLEEAVKSGRKFENQVEWGIDLASEHERYVTVFYWFLLLELWLLMSKVL